MPFPLDTAALRAATLTEVADTIAAAQARLAALDDPILVTTTELLGGLAQGLRLAARAPAASPATRHRF